eukprot:jgi/Chrzof1/6028/Cz17g02120.t1
MAAWSRKVSFEDANVNTPEQLGEKPHMSRLPATADDSTLHESTIEIQSGMSSPRGQASSASYALLSNRNALQSFAAQHLTKAALTQDNNAILSGNILSSGGITLPSGFSGTVVPVQPATVYEHSVAARPNFKERQVAGYDFWFVTVNVVMLSVLVAASVLDVKFH